MIARLLQLSLGDTTQILKRLVEHLLDRLRSAAAQRLVHEHRAGCLGDIRGVLRRPSGR